MDIRKMSVGELRRDAIDHSTGSCASWGATCVYELARRLEAAEADRDSWKAIAEKRHAILLDLEWVVDAKDGDGSYCPYCMSMDDEVHVAGCKMAEAIAESARAANGGGE